MSICNGFGRKRHLHISLDRGFACSRGRLGLFYPFGFGYMNSAVALVVVQDGSEAQKSLVERCAEMGFRYPLERRTQPRMRLIRCSLTK